MKFTDEFPDIQCIYMITHMPTGRTYVGATGSLKRRIEDHYRGLVNCSHNSLILEDDFYNSGEHAFDVTILEPYVKKLSKRKLRQIELFFINKYPSIYNVNGNKECDHSARARALQSIIFSYRNGEKFSPVINPEKFQDRRFKNNIKEPA